MSTFDAAKIDIFCKHGTPLVHLLQNKSKNNQQLNGQLLGNHARLILIRRK